MPITKAEAQGVTRAFVRDYPGALELAYKFREDAAELYGPRAAEVPADMKGGYVPKETLHAGRAYRGRVDVPLQNVESASDLLAGAQVVEHPHQLGPVALRPGSLFLEDADAAGRAKGGPLLLQVLPACRDMT